jgi:hypothetical protein
MIADDDIIVLYKAATGSGQMSISQDTSGRYDTFRITGRTDSGSVTAAFHLSDQEALGLADGIIAAAQSIQPAREGTRP